MKTGAWISELLSALPISKPAETAAVNPMPDFAAQRLSKNGMNAVRGGVTGVCDVLDVNGNTVATVKGEGAMLLDAWVDAANTAYGYKVANCKS